MSALTIDDLFRYLAASAGESESGIAPADGLDVPFDDLGYDSLALMETAALIHREMGVEIGEEQVADVRTPRQMLELVNESASTAV